MNFLQGNLSLLWDDYSLINILPFTYLYGHLIDISHMVLMECLLALQLSSLHTSVLIQ